jgi:hypothetical protein
MNVAELIDILRDLDPETIVEMAIVAPVTEHSDDITVDQYEVEGVLPRDPADHDGESVVWLIEGAGDNVQTGEYADVIDIDRGAEARKAIFGV